MSNWQKKRFECIFIFIFLFLLLLLASCSEPMPNAPPVVASRPSRIVSLSPSVTEILYGIKAFDRVVAVSDYCTYPPEALRLPRVGGWINPHKERIATLQADLIIGAGAQAPFIEDEFKQLNITVRAVSDQTLDDAFRAIHEIGDATGNTTEAAQLADATRAELEAVREQVRNRPRPRVLLVADRLPGTLRGMYVATRGSFIVELVEAAGGEPVALPSDKPYVEISKEALADVDPDIIIEIVQSNVGIGISFAEDTRAVWQELPQLKAVRENRVYSLQDATIVHPSQFVAQTARAFAEIIHPEAFKSEQ